MTPQIVPRSLPKGKAELPRPYAKLPHDLAADPRLLPIDVRLLLAIVYYARDKDHCWPSDNTLGARIGRARPTVQRRLRHLEALGLIGREKCDANATGRLIRLRWIRRTDETPPVSRTTAAPISSVRHEWEKQSEKLCAPPGGKAEGGGGEGEQATPATPPAGETPVAIRAYHGPINEGGTGWLDKPPGDPLRAIAERRLAVALSGPPEAPSGLQGQATGTAPTSGPAIPTARQRPRGYSYSPRGDRGRSGQGGPRQVFST